MGRHKKQTKQYAVRAYKETIAEIRKSAVLINKKHEKSIELTKRENTALK